MRVQRRTDRESRSNGGNATGEGDMSYAIFAFAATLCLVLFLRGQAHRVGLVDKPAGRKMHSGEIPLIGGLAIGGGFFLALLMQQSVAVNFLPLAMGCLVIFLTGLIDDLQELSASTKALGQVIAAVLMVSWANVYLLDLGNLFGAGTVALGILAIPVTVVGVLGLINAMNMIDGADGLAGGIGAIAALWLAFAALALGHFDDASVLFTLVAATAGFLVFNLRYGFRKRASVFLGDAGSMFLGFILVWFTVHLTQGNADRLYPISALWILALPIMDTVYLMVYRVAAGQSPFLADRNHIHHVLGAMGFSTTKSVAILLGVSAIFGAIGFFGWFFKIPEPVLAGAFFGLFAVQCVVRLRWQRSTVQNVTANQKEEEAIA
jgi:UDP-GlcNAc:undecaprenyl-phosphate/decaprenyl-phosphate GlcNAc-1-phosphate transferase